MGARKIMIRYLFSFFLLNASFLFFFSLFLKAVKKKKFAKELPSPVKKIGRFFQQSVYAVLLIVLLWQGKNFYMDLPALVFHKYSSYKGLVLEEQFFKKVKTEHRNFSLDLFMKVEDIQQEQSFLYLEKTGIVLKLNEQSSSLFDFWETKPLSKDKMTEESQNASVKE